MSLYDTLLFDYLGSDTPGKGLGAKAVLDKLDDGGVAAAFRLVQRGVSPPTICSISLDLITKIFKYVGFVMMKF